MTDCQRVVGIMDTFPKKLQGPDGTRTCLYWRSAVSVTLAIRFRKGWAAIVVAAAAEGLHRFGERIGRAG